MTGKGKLPPSAVDLEEAVLGAILSEKEALNEVIGILKPQDFYKPAHIIIYQAILDMYYKSEQIDILTVSSHLRKNKMISEVGGASYITGLTGRVNSAAHIATHARVVAEYSLGRRIINLGASLQMDGYSNPDYIELLNKLSKEVFQIESSFFTKEVDTIRKISKEVMEDVVAAGKSEDGVIGVRTGISSLDKGLRGLMHQNLIIIAARPGLGKSSLVHTIARNSAVMFNTPVAIFSLEMSKKEVVRVIHSIQCEIETDKLISGDLEESEWIMYNQRVNPVLEAPIFIDDSPGLTIMELRSKARNLVMKHGVQLIIVDYLQLMHGVSDKKNFNREQEIGFISRQLKEMAKELNIPVVALSQLSRAVETRGGDKRPQLSDLRDSGSIEQDADVVIFLYRASYYGFTEDSEGVPITPDHTEVIVSKFRNGKTKTINLSFIGKFKKFKDYGDAESSFVQTFKPLPRTPYNDFDSSGPKLASKDEDDIVPF
jgi:replicative DNA helicase